MESNKTDWIKDYERIKRNPIFFIEEYYNQLHPDNEICLTDVEKQHFYNKYRVNMIPMLDEIDFKAVGEYEKRIEDLRKQGYKNWEIF